MRFPSWALGGKTSREREFPTPALWEGLAGALGSVSNAAEYAEVANVSAQSPTERGRGGDLYSCPTFGQKYLRTSV